MVEAWTVSFELAQYEGPMAEVFAMMEAFAAGDITRALDDSRFIKPVRYKTGPCEEECGVDLHNAQLDNMNALEVAIVTCDAVAVAAVVPAIITANVWGLIGIGVGFGICVGNAAWTWWNASKVAERDYGICMGRCAEEADLAEPPPQ